MEDAAREPASPSPQAGEAGGTVMQSPFAWLSDELFERIFWIALCIAAFVPYLVINRVTASWPARDLTFALDRAVPFQPGWELCYLSVYLVVFLPGFHIRHPGLFRRAIASFIGLQLICYPVFLLMPVGIDRPESAIDPARGFAEWMLALNYAHDAPRNLFPSLHVANAVLVALEAWRIDRPVGAAAGVMAGLIAYSTLAVKQHAFIDVVAGALVAAFVYAAVFRRYPLDGRAPGDLRFGRGVLLALPIAWIVGMGSFYVAMRLGLQPFTWPPVR